MTLILDIKNEVFFVYVHIQVCYFNHVICALQIMTIIIQRKGNVIVTLNNASAI